jgi:hypothetical protein
MITKTEKSEISNPTLAHLEDWMEAIRSVDDRQEPIFKSLDELATKLEQWRVEFMEECKELAYHWGDMVTVATYGNEVILISDQRSGEYIKILFTSNPIAS